jgi:hypothetical protein
VSQQVLQNGSGDGVSTEAEVPELGAVPQGNQNGIEFWEPMIPQSSKSKVLKEAATGLSSRTWRGSRLKLVSLKPLRSSTFRQTMLLQRERWFKSNF